MTSNTHRAPALDLSQDAEAARAHALLQRYPDVSSEEAQQIKRFLAKGRFFSVGQVRGDACIQPQLDAFLADHPDTHRLSARDYVKAALVVSIPLTLFCLLMWDFGL